ncbi:hypothetical protein ACFWU5_16565 [Nocardia sp. NPDC058640]|uniref:hypothetical protein n=1 Tax=Nocardia sp. NPDC058640 TaxID=3346571 RepID=UPI0036644DA0
MTVDQMRDDMHATFAEIKHLQAVARTRGDDYTGTPTTVPERRGVFGRIITPARTVRPSEPTVADMIAIRWDAIRWYQHQIRTQLNVPHPTR